MVNDTVMMVLLVQVYSCVVTNTIIMIIKVCVQQEPNKKMIKRHGDDGTVREGVFLHSHSHHHHNHQVFVEQEPNI